MDGSWQHFIKSRLFQVLMLSTTKRKHWWRRVGKQQFLLLKMLHDDLWERWATTAMELSPGERTAGWWFVPVLRNDFPCSMDTSWPLLLICCTWHCIAATQEKKGLQMDFATTWLSQCAGSGHGPELILTGFNITGAGAPGNLLKSDLVSLLAFHSFTIGAGIKW